MTVVPDAIEPYYGYKALKMMADGHLESPTQHATWPKKQALKAVCRNTKNMQPTYTWKQVRAPEDWAEMMFWVPSTFLTEGATTTFSWPSGNPEPGHTWIPEEQPHKLGECTCGIYAVEHPKQTNGYMQGPNAVLVQIALWGQVVPGDRGARGEFAYPQMIFAAEQQSELALFVSDQYDIPVEIVTFLPKENE